MKSNKIYIWISVIIIGIILSFLYNPIGNNLKYTSDSNYSIVTTNTNFKNTTIKHSKRNYIQQPISAFKTSNNYIFITKRSNNIKPLIQPQNNYKSYNTINKKDENNNSSFSNGGYLFIKGSRNSSSSTYFSNYIVPFSNETHASNNTTQYVPFNNPVGGTIIVDPGGDPTGPPIPVGDGTYILFFLGIVYIIYKKYKL